MNMINQSHDYVYMESPYLIISYTLMNAMCLAAKRGVDVRLITPHVADKWYVHIVTQAHYAPLIEAGVKVYEYTPGFNHCKNIVSDDRIGLCGSVNTDYRSYFLHFEDGIMMYNSPAVMDMKKDFMDSLKQSQEVTLQDCQNVNLFVRLFSAVLRLMAMLF